MKKILCLVMLSATLLFGSVYSNDVFAYIPDDDIFDELGEYIVTEPTMETIKVYINSDMVDIIEETGVTVYTSETRHYFLGIYIYSTYKYYHYVDKYVDNIVTQRSIYNDIDSLIFILSELDNFAHEYSDCQGDETNCVLGFIRSTSNSYANTSTLYGGKWALLAGDVNEGFVQYVDDNDGAGLEISEYFSAFIPTHQDDTEYDKVNFNSELHGNAYSGWEFYDGQDYYTGLKQYFLVDPFNYSSNIDLVHMFASLDGIYNSTGNSLSFGNDHNRDIVSWGGDLQQMADKMRYVDVSSLPTYTDIGGGYSNVSIDLCSFVGYEGCLAPEEDILADIDAMNIAVSYLDNDINDRVSVAFSSYYNIINYDDSYFPNRYKMFLHSITNTIELDNPGTTDTEKFKHEVYITLDVIPDGTTYKNYYLILGETYVGYGLLRGSTWPTAGSLPNVELRGYIADLFIEYILDMASRPYYYG